MELVSPEIRLLRYFLVAAREPSFRKAAARLVITQPALSHHMATLEHVFGRELFVRSRRGVELTEAGRLLVGRAEDLIRALNETVTDIRGAADGLGGVVRIAATPSAAAGLVSTAFVRFRAERPGVSLSLREAYSEDALDMLEDRLVDLVIARGPTRRPGITAEVLIDEEVVLVVARDHLLAGRARVQMQALAAEPFVMIGADWKTTLHATVISACAEAGFTPAIACQGAELMTMGRMVAAGIGVGLIPQSMAALLRDQKLAEVHLRPAPRSTLLVAHRSGSVSAAAGDFRVRLLDTAHGHRRQSG